MTVQIQIELPESVFSALRSNPDGFVQEMRLAAAVKWYEIEMNSQAKAAEIAGVSRQEFIEGLARFNVGMNINRAAGQSMMHSNIHIIPRYQGDAVGTKSGMRCVIPKGKVRN